MTNFRIGIDFGGSKIEIAAVPPKGRPWLRRRVPTPASYPAAIAAIMNLVRNVETRIGAKPSVGVCVPGRTDQATGLVRSRNCLDGRPLRRDLCNALEREVRVANDGNCFALSEAVDGAGRGARVVFGAVLGTGCSAGVVVDGRLLIGRNGLAGEWAHIPFPFDPPHEPPARRCWCGRLGCLETVISGTALAVDCDGPGARGAAAVAERAAAGDRPAQAALDRHVRSLARALAGVINLLDPDVIVLGGGMSNMDHLYARLPALIAQHVFGNVCATPVRRPVHGDSSGVRGAAWLWPGEPEPAGAVPCPAAEPSPRMGAQRQPRRDRRPRS